MSCLFILHNSLRKKKLNYFKGAKIFGLIHPPEGKLKTTGWNISLDSLFSKLLISLPLEKY